jgi:Secretion system C-terminal sorting domain
MKKLLLVIIISILTGNSFAQTYTVKVFQDTSYIEIDNFTSLLKERKGNINWTKRFNLNFTFPFYDSLYKYIICDHTAVCFFDNEPDFGIRLLTSTYDLDTNIKDTSNILSDIRYKLTSKNGINSLVVQYTKNRLADDPSIAQFDSNINMQHWFYADGSIEIRFGDFNLSHSPLYKPGKGFFIDTGDSLLNLGPEVGVKHPFNPVDQTYIHGTYLNFMIDNSFEGYLTTIPPKGWVIRFERKPVATKDVNTYTSAIYPNPASDILNIKSKEPIEQIKIYDTKGIIHSLSKYEIEKIPISNLASGLYFIEIKYKNKIEIQKFIKN